MKRAIAAFFGLGCLVYGGAAILAIAFWSLLIYVCIHILKGMGVL